MYRYKGIIFDLDGVICSTDRFHYQAWKHLAQTLGIPFDERVNDLLRGVSRMESLEIILRHGGLQLSTAEKERLAGEKNEEYRRLLEQMSPNDLSAAVWNTLETLRVRGFRLAIGSSSKNAPFILQRIGLGNYFDAVADGNCITHSKPHPEVFLKAAQMLSLSPTQCLVVEDARAGVEAATAGGFDCAAIGDAQNDEMAKYHLTEFADLLRCVC